MRRKKLSIILSLLVLMMNILIPPGIVFSDEINGSDVPAASSELPKDQANASDTTSDSSTSSELPKDQSNASDTTSDASTSPDLSKNQTNVSDAPSTSEDASDKKADAIQNNTDASASNGEKTIISRVTYNANAGRNSGVVKNDQIALNGSYTIGTIGTGTGELHFTAPDPSKQIFNGWNTDPNGSGDSYSAGQVVSSWPYSTDTILYAQWADATNVSYNLNGATGQSAPTSQFGEVGSQVTIPKIPENLVFKGNTTSAGVWNSKADGTGTDYVPNTSYTLTSSNITLYLKIVASPADANATLTFDLNGGDTSDTDLKNGIKTDVANDYKVNLPSQVPIKSGYTFKGWTINSKTYQPSGEFTLIYSTIAKAIWMPIQTISFENGLLEGSTDLVTGMPDGTFVEANGNLYNIPDNVPERKVTDGSSVQYKFLYWRLNDKVNVFPGGQWRTNTVVSTSHFVAVWSSFDLNSQWTLSFNTDGATGGSAPYEYTYVDKGKPFIIPGRGSLTKSGASFVGWSDGETTYSEGDAFTPTKNTTLSAVWSQDETQGTVKFVTQSKAGSNPTSQTGETGTVITLPDAPQNNTAPEDGYIFWGWAKNKNATIPDYYANKSYTLSKGVTTLYGVWTGSLTNYWTQIKVNVNGADGSLPSGITSNNFYSLDSETAIHVFEVPEITKTGYNLIGWDYSKDDQTYQVTDKIELGNMATTRNPGTLTAKWEPITYKVSYDKGDATSGAIPTQDIAIVGYKKAYTLLGNSGYLSKVGFTFVGWTDGTETYTPGQNMAPTTDIVLKPVWKINPTTSGGGNTNNVNIMYVALESGVTGEVPDSVSIPGDYTTSYRVAYPKSDFSYPGYEFLGWYLLDAKGNEVDYSPGSTFVVGNNDLIFYAKWRSKQDVPKDSYAISFNGNGNTSGLVPNTQYVKSGGSATLPGNNTLENKQFKDNNASTGAINTNDYIFVGWSKNKNATADDADVLQKGASISPTSNEVYYAIWDLEKKDITLTFNGNGNTGGTVPAKVTRMRYTEEKIDSLNLGATLTKTVVISGELVTYHFGGWNTQEDGKGIDYRSGSTFNFPKNTTLYAKWIPTKSNSLARILYLGNGNTSGDPIRFDDTNSVEYTIKDAGNMLKDGYMFTGWNTRSDGTGTSYNIGSSIVTADHPSLTLYAQWVKVESGINVIYNGNGNTSGTLPDAFNGPKGSNVTLASTSDVSSRGLKKTGYMFAGWSKTVSGQGVQYVAGQSYTFNENTILYAIWAEDAAYVATPSNITYHPNYTNADGIYNVKGFVDKSMPVDGTTVLHGHKVVKNEENGGAYLGESYALVSYSVTGLPSRKNYAFSGWSTNPQATTPMYTAQQVISLNTTNLDLYAVWTPGNYQIEFDKNASDVTGTMVKQTVNYDETQKLNINKYKRAGYSFMGWNTKSDGSGISYADEQSISNLADADETETLYAQWAKTEYYSILFDLNAGSDRTAKTKQKTIPNLEIGTKYSLSSGIKTASRAGYKFNGWYTTADGTIEMPESLVIPKSNTTYYANWTANNYTVSYDKNTGSGTMADQNFTYDVAKNLSQNNFGKDGYVFTGWNTSADGSGIAYSNSQSVSNLTTASGGKVTLYAQWQAKSEFGDSNSKTTDPTDMLPTTGELVSNYITILGVIILVSIAYVGFKRNKKYK